MNTARTAISIDLELLKKTDKEAKETNNSRSGVIAIALSKYFAELEQQRISELLDEVYEEDGEDSNFVKAANQYFSNKILEQEEW